MSVPYFGDFSEDATVYIPFNTFDSNDPSASVTVTNLAAGDIKVHKDGSTTQIVTDGATVAINFDSITGNHLITIDTSVHADYSTGSDYMVRLEGITVDAATLNVWVGSFSIENRHGSTTANSILTDSEAVLADSEAILVDTGTTLDTVVDSILTDTEAILVDTGTTLDTVVDSILTDTEAILVDTGTTLLADTEAILEDTNELQTDDIPGSLATLLTDTEAILTDTGTTLDTIVDSILTDTEALLVDTEALDTATILTDTEAILADTGTTLDTIVDSILVDTEAILADTEGLSAGSGLTPLATGTAQGGTASTIVLASASSFADNVLNGNIIKIHTGTGAGQSRLILSNTLSDDTCNVTPNWTTNPSSDSEYEIVEGAANVTAVSLTAQSAGDIISDTEAILEDTNELQTDDIPGSLATLLTDTEAILTDTGTTLDTVVDSILTDTEAIVADTESGTHGLAVLLSDTEAILTDTGTTLDTVVDSILTDTEAILTDTGTTIPAVLGTPIDFGSGTSTLAANLQDMADNGTATFDRSTDSLQAMRDEMIADTEAIVADTNELQSDDYPTTLAAILGDTEALDTATILTDTEAILTDTEASQTAESSILTDTEAAITARSTLLTDTEAILTDTEAATAVLTDTEAILADSEAVIVDTENLDLGIIYGSAATGTLSTTQATSDLTGYADDQLIGRIIIWTSGNADGEATDITDYVNASGLLTFTALTTAPANGDTFKIV